MVVGREGRREGGWERGGGEQILVWMVCVDNVGGNSRVSVSYVCG